MTDKTQANAHACIKPQCDPEQCPDCACAITPSDGAGHVVLDMLNTFAVNDLGHPFEDGDSAAADRARQWLQNRSATLQAAPLAPSAVPVLYVSPEQLEKHLDLEGAENAESGRYLPARKTPAGKFTQPLYALAATPTQAQTYPVLDDAWRRRMLDGAVLVRDEMGCGDHPALPTLEEGMKPVQFFDALGIELTGSMAESEMDSDAYEAMVDACDSRTWTPEAPDGEGWLLVSIFETEDGPSAWWMREAAPEQRARRNRKTPPAKAQEDAHDAERFRAMANAAITENAAFAECLERLGGDCKTIDDIRAVFDAAHAAQVGA